MSEAPRFELETGKFPDNYAIPMILHCPECSGRHIDEGAFAELPHHTHACQHCGFVWRPAKVNTHGVRFLPGYVNVSWIRISWWNWSARRKLVADTMGTYPRRTCTMARLLPSDRAE